MPARRQHGQPILITDAAASFEEEQAHRRHAYLLIMAIHLIGFALSYPLYLLHPWAGVGAVLATGALPWVAVLVANQAAAATRAPAHAEGLDQQMGLGNGDSQ